MLSGLPNPPWTIKGLVKKEAYGNAIELAYRREVVPGCVCHLSSDRRDGMIFRASETLPVYGQAHRDLQVGH